MYVEWTEEAICLSRINDYPKAGLKMIGLDCMIKTLRLAWLHRIYKMKT